MQTQWPRLTINLDPDTHAALMELAARRDSSAAQVVRRAVRELLHEAGFSLPPVHVLNKRKRRSRHATPSEVA